MKQVFIVNYPQQNLCGALSWVCCRPLQEIISMNSFTSYKAGGGAAHRVRRMEMVERSTLGKVL